MNFYLTFYTSFFKMPSSDFTSFKMATSHLGFNPCGVLHNEGMQQLFSGCLSENSKGTDAADVPKWRYTVGE